MFEALVHERLNSSAFDFEVSLSDIHELNARAFRGEVEMIKVSYNAFARLQDKWELLDAGSALGFGCGPLLVAKPGLTLKDLTEKNAKIAIPGIYTTANLLLHFFAPELTNKKEYLFHEILPAVQSGEVDAGLIIHENRFTYGQFGLHCLQDLGEFWEHKTQLPIPLGAIIVKKDLPLSVKNTLANLMRESVQYAFQHPQISRNYVCLHAQEMDEAVIKSHIDLYVNSFSLSLGEKGTEAIKRLFSEGESAGILPLGTVASFSGSIKGEVLAS